MNLRTKNWLAASAHIGSFLMVVILFNIYGASQSHTGAQTFRYTLPNPTNPVGGQSCNSNGKAQEKLSGQCQTDPIFGPPKKTFQFDVIYGVLLFFAITAYAHIFYATDGFNTGKYSRVISEGWNPYRWVEYGLSASVMTVLIAYELGIKDSNHLMSLVFINVAMQTCGFLVENALIQPHINPTAVKGATTVGWLLLLGMWVPILYAFSTIVKDVNEYFKGKTEPDGPAAGKPIKVPGFVWFIIIVQLFNFSSFGLIQMGQVRDTLAGRPKPYDVYESRYLTLSFAGKLALASGLAYGLLFRTRDC
jgi:hypothetical protein